MADALMFAAQALSPDQWHALSATGIAIRRPVDAPTTEPAAGESLPTVRLAIAELPTAKQTPGVRDAALNALHSSHHTADAVRPEPAAIDRLNAATRPSEPLPQSRAGKRRGVVVLASLGVAAIGAAAIVASRSWSQPPERIIVSAAAHDAAAVHETVTVDAMAELDFIPPPRPTDAGVTDTKVATSRRARDAAIEVASLPPRAAPDAAVATRDQNAAQATSTPSKSVPNRHGPIPEKYRSIPGVEIDPSDYYITAARVTLTQPFPDLAKLDAVRYAATAKQLARKFESDAELTQVYAVVHRDGSLKRGPQYYFSSRQARASNDEGRLDCIHVHVQPWDKPVVVVGVGGSTDCDKRAGAPLPKCSLSEVAKQFPGTDEWYFVHYNDTGWRVGHNSNGAIIAKFPDDC
jgi:hypothetical protein